MFFNNIKYNLQIYLDYISQKNMKFNNYMYFCDLIYYDIKIYS
ncbi:hypothetical protein CCYN49044_290026 [Capnocytophaga cynodegmi]|nr:hypothetical protein CCYN49044_290026 [Capnocytophaga cynodegmi]